MPLVARAVMTGGVMTIYHDDSSQKWLLLGHIFYCIC